MQDMHTTFTDKEVHLIQRHRTVAHRIFRLARNILALCGLAFIVTFFWMVQASRQARHAYVVQARELQQASSQATSATSPMKIFADSYTTPSDLVSQHLAKYQPSFDSLHLTDKVLGFTLFIEVLPTGVKGERSCTSAIGYFATDCGCERDSLDYYVFGLEQNFQHARVATSQKVTLAEYTTQNRHTSGSRR